jgi:hypothetical protein
MVHLPGGIMDRAQMPQHARLMPGHGDATAECKICPGSLKKLLDFRYWLSLSDLFRGSKQAPICLLTTEN